MKKIKDWQKLIGKILHIPTSIILLSIAVLFSILIFKVFIDVIIEYFYHDLDLIIVLERIFVIFLFIEVVASIKIYFQEGYHFPLRFFVYIGITHLIRYSIIHHEDTLSLLFITIAVLILIIGLAVLDLKNDYIKKLLNKGKKEIKENDFEL